MGRQVIDWCDRCGKVISRRQDAGTITWVDTDLNKNWDLCEVCKDELKKWLYVQPTYSYEIRVTRYGEE